jgi:hypothetical protein
MKKLLLVLLVVALASFLFVGCIPVTPPPNGEEGEGEVEVCPTVSITSEVEIAGKKYIKGAAQTITVTFTEATEPVAVYVADAIKDYGAGVPDDAVELVMYADADKKVYTGEYRFGTAGLNDCYEGYIYVTTCATCAPCKFAYTVDEEGPCSLIKLYEGTNCSCGGFDIVFKGGTSASTCITCCNDYCTALDEYTIDLYKTNPFDVCCDVPCASTIASCSGTGCEIDCTMLCVNIADYTVVDTKDFYLVATLKDKVGNSRRYYAIVNIDSDDIITVQEYRGLTSSGTCTNWTVDEKLNMAVDTIGTSVTNYYATIGGCAIDIYGTCSDTPDGYSVE